MARTTGDDRNVYASLTQPTSLTVPTGYTKVGQRTNVGLSSQGQSIEIRDADGASVEYGSNTITNTLAVNYDPTQDDGAILLRNAHFNPIKPTVWFLETSGIVGEENVTYQAKIGGYTEAHQVGSAATQTFTLGIISTPAFAPNA